MNIWKRKPIHTLSLPVSILTRMGGRWLACRNHRQMAASLLLRLMSSSSVDDTNEGRVRARFFPVYFGVVLEQQMLMTVQRRNSTRTG